MLSYQNSETVSETIGKGLEESATLDPMAGIRQKRIERMKARMRELRVNGADVARVIGVTPGTISHIMTEKTLNSNYFPAIARALHVNLAWLLGDTDTKIEMLDLDGRPIEEEALITLMQNPEFRLRRISEGECAIVEIEHPQQPDDIVGVRELDMSLGLGATYLDTPVTERMRYFSRAFLGAYTRAQPENLIFAEGLGDSMMPTIYNSDLMLIDCTQQSVAIQDKIWAISYANCGAVKRLRPRADGGIEMISDNPNVPNEIAYDGEMNILGRVVAIIRKM